MPNLVLSGKPLVEVEIAAILREARLRLSISPSALSAVRKCRDVIERAVNDEKKTIYGVNTGFGRLVNVHIPEDKIGELQHNLILSHCVGLGDPLPLDIVRLSMAFRVNSLARGFSGVRPLILETLLAMFNKQLTPKVPRQGSVAASGDLAPLAHIAAVMIGEGEAFYRGKCMKGGAAMKAAGINTITLKAKEGIALVNGTQVTLAILASTCLEARELAKTADIAGASSLEALRGSAKPFDKRLHEVRPHPGQKQCAENLRALLKNSGVMKSHKDCHKVQDNYSLRCMPQVHGASRDTMDHVWSIIVRETGSVTDNPIVFPDSGEVISGGNFHGEPLAMSADFLAIALAELASISERRIETMVNPDLSELPPFLSADSGLNSGLMMAQVTAAALVSENKVLCHPASVDSIPTSANKEDHVSMGTHAALKCRQVLENARAVLAIEFMASAQGLDYHKPLKPGTGVHAAHQIIRKKVPTLKRDRYLHDDMVAIIDLLKHRNILIAVEKKTGALK